MYCTNDKFDDHYGELTTPRVGDTVHILTDANGDPIICFLVDRKRNVPLYWNVQKQYDSTKKVSTRAIGKDGYYHILLTANGERGKEFITDDKAIVDDIDSKYYMGIETEEDGKTIKAVYSYSSVAGIGNSTASWTDVTKLTKDEVTSFKDPNSGVSYAGQTYHIPLNENTKVYNVSTNSGFVGEKTTLKVGDRIHVFTDYNGEGYIIFVVTRRLSLPVYWNVEKKYDSTKKQTTRTPDEDGYYHILLTTGGKEPEEFITNNKTLVDDIDSRYYMGAQIASDGKTILKVVFPTQVNGFGSSTASWTDVTSVTSSQVVSYKDPNSGVSYAGETYRLKLNSKTEVYNVSGTGDFVGQKTELSVGDRIHVFTTTDGVTCKLVYVVGRRDAADIYFMQDRKYNSTTKETTRTPDEDGYYHVFATTNGEEPVELVTNDKSIMNFMDSLATRMVGLLLEEDGKTIKKAIYYYNSKGYGVGTASWTTIQTIDPTGFTSLKDNDPSSSEYGKSYTVKCDGETKVYNVSEFYYGETEGHHLGETTTLKLNDLVHAITRQGSDKAAIVYVVGRSYEAVEHKNTHICQGCGQEVEWTPWLKANSLPTTAGHYYLCGDVQLTSTQSVSTAAHVALCYNGYNITFNGGGRVYYGSGSGSDITMGDCTGDSVVKSINYPETGDWAGLFGWGRYGTLKVFGGTYDLTGVKTNGNAPAFYSSADQILELHDVTIIGGESTKSGGAVSFVGGSKGVLDNVTIKGAKGLYGDMIAVSKGADVTLKGALKFEDVDTTALYLMSGAKLTLTEGLTVSGGSVKLADKTGAFTTNYFEGAENLFTSADTAYTVGTDGKQLIIGTGAATGLTVEPTVINLHKSEVYEINPVITPSTASTQQLLFSVYDEAICTVDENGVITASTENEGSSTLTVSVKGTSLTKQITVNVEGEAALIESFTLEKEAVTATVGGVIENKVTILPAEADYQKYTITSSDETVVSVEDGKFSALKAGTATITLKAVLGTAEKTFEITVEDHKAHCTCGDGTCTLTGHTCNATQEWLPWSDSTKLPDSGAYYLTTDLNLTARKTYKNADLYICLNGHTINSTSNIALLSENANIVFTDCAETPGSIVLNGTTQSGGGIGYMQTNVSLGIFHITVDASKFQNSFGSVVYTDNKVAKLSLYDAKVLGGKVVGSSSNGQGGIVYLQSKDFLYVDKCEFVGGEALASGGIFRISGTTEVRNSTFTGGKAPTGGNIYTASNNPKLFENITVTGAVNGGGFYVAGYTVTLGGKVTIKDNAGGNLVFSSDSSTKATVSTTGIDSTSEIYVTSPDGKGFLVSETDYTAVIKTDNSEQAVSYDATNKVHKLSVPAHEHCICGGDVTAGDHTSHTAVTWVGVGSQAEITALITTSSTTVNNYVYLTKDIQLTSTIAMKANNHLSICLNGHKLIAAKNARNIQAYASGNESNVVVNICDCSEGGVGEVTAHAETTASSYSGGNILIFGSGTCNLYSGRITNGRPAENAGNVSIQNNSSYATGKAVFNMYGGEISGGISGAKKNGGNVMIAGTTSTMNIYGGTVKDGMITYNPDSTCFGGNIYVTGGNLNVFGGTITGGTCKETDQRDTGSKFFGGNIAVANSGIVNISGGTISDGIAYNGGNIGFVTNGKLTITGGTINNGRAKYGANITQTDGTMTINGGTFTNGVIHSSGNGANIYATKGTTTINGGFFGKNTTAQNVDCASTNDKMYINGGTFEGIVVTFRGWLYITGGNFQNKIWKYYTSDGALELSGGKYV